MKARPGLDDAKPYAAPPSREGKVHLDLNENTRGPSPRVLERLRDLDGTELSYYPDYVSLQDALGREYRVSGTQVLLTNGGDDGIRCVMDTFLDPGQKVAMVEPSFSMFRILAGLREAEVVQVPYREGLVFPTEELIAQGRSSRILVLVNPNSPTGEAISEETLRHIIASCPETLVFLDETYHHFHGKVYTHWVNEYPNLLVLHTFSKVYGLAGIRLGVLVSNEKTITELRKVNLPYAANSVGVIAGIAALEDSSYVDQVVSETRAEKERLREDLERLGGKVRDTDTNFVVVDFGSRGPEYRAQLAEKGVLVKDLNGLHLMKGHLRISVGTAADHDRLIDALEDIVPVEAILFDMDGVLVDVSQSYRKAIMGTVEHFTGSQVTAEEVQAYKNRGGLNNDWDLTLAIVTERGKQVSREDVIDHFQSLYLGKNHGSGDWDGLITNEAWQLKDEVYSELAKKYKLGIVTGRPREEALFALEHAGFRDRFEVVIGMEDVGERSKPDPYGLELAKEKLGVTWAAYIGDTGDDMIAAKRARCRAIGRVPPHINVDSDPPPHTYAAMLTDRGGLIEVLNVLDELVSHPTKYLGSARL